MPSSSHRKNHKEKVRSYKIRLVEAANRHRKLKARVDTLKYLAENHPEEVAKINLD